MTNWSKRKRLEAAIAGEAVDRLPVATRRNAVLLFSAYFALGEGLPEAALHFENVLIDSLGESGTAAGRGDAYIQRARTLGRLGRPAEALKDLDCARGFVSAVADRALRERLLARVRIAHLHCISGRPNEATQPRTGYASG